MVISIVRVSIVKHGTVAPFIVQAQLRIVYREMVMGTLTRT